MRETLESLEKILKKEIKTVADKGTMTPSELDAVTKAICLYQIVEERLMLEGGYDAFRSNDNYSQRYYRDMMPEEMSYNSYDGSYARGRSPITGRYVSRDRGGRSGHSVKDRMIDALERMIDQAGGEYERQEIMRQIEKIRNGNE